jgi:hypothetical protein
MIVAVTTVSATGLAQAHVSEWVINCPVGSEIQLPVFPEQRTSSDRASMAQRGRKRKSDLICRPMGSPRTAVVSSRPHGGFQHGGSFLLLLVAAGGAADRRTSLFSINSQLGWTSTPRMFRTVTSGIRAAAIACRSCATLKDAPLTSVPFQRPQGRAASDARAPLPG